MRGKVDDADRATTRAIWAKHTVPDLINDEIRPVAPLLDGRTSLVALDIGANKGYWAKGFLRVFGTRVRHIYMVEPSPENCAELARRDDNLMFDAEDFTKLSVDRVAMGAHSGEARLYTNEDGSPLASLYPHPLNGYAGDLRTIDLSLAIDVPMTTVDSFLAEKSCDHVDIIKLDVEGHELAVLQGAHDALTNRRIDIISLEFGVHQVESRHFFKDFYIFLSDYGFDLFFIRQSGLEQVTNYEYRYEDFSTNFQLVGRRSASPAQRNPPPLDDVAPPPADLSLAEQNHLRKAARTATHERDGYASALRTLQDECASRDARHAEEMRTLQATFEQSTSWRVTSPLRAIAHLFRRSTRI